MSTAAIRAALKAKFPGRTFRITKAGEIHELRTQGTLMRRGHWFLFAYVDSPELPLMLGLVEAA
jgi:hypothetical protein